MKKYQLYLYVVALGLSLCATGCAKTPDEVQKNIDYKKQAETNTEQSSDKKYKTLKEIWASKDQALQKKYQNLKISDKLKIREVDSCNEEEFEVVDGFASKDKELFKKYIGKDYNEKYWSDGANLNPPGPEYSDEDHGFYAGISNNGFFMWSNENEISLDMETKEEAVYNLLTNYEDKSYEVSDGELKVSEAVKMAEAAMKKWSEDSGDSLTIPYQAVVSKIKDSGKYCIAVNFQKLYENVPLFVRIVNENNLGKQKINSMDGVEICITKKEGVSSINNQNILKHVKTIKQDDKIVSIEGALDSANQLLASYHVYTVNEIGIQYIFIPENYKDDDKKSAGRKYTTKPYWIIGFEDSDDKDMFVAVDCETGEACLGGSSDYTEGSTE